MVEPTRTKSIRVTKYLKKLAKESIPRFVSQEEAAVARQISPHTLRHTTAMHLLQSGVDIAVIALWLGHEETATTHRYIEANLALMEQALSRIEEMPSPPLRYRADDELLKFLDGL